MKHKGFIIAGIAALTACIIILFAAYAMAASMGKCASGGPDDCYSAWFGTLSTVTNSTSYCAGAYFDSAALGVYNGGSVGNVITYTLQTTMDATGATGWTNAGATSTGLTSVIKDTTNSDHNLVEFINVYGICARIHVLANTSTNSTLIINGIFKVR